MRQSDLPKVTAVVPTHQRAEKVGRALRSVLAQTYRPLEAVVVDDASTDDTAEVVAAAARESVDVEVRYLRHDVNGGGAAARNTGVAAASGELVAFLDSDDEWLPSKTSAQVDAWLASSAPAATVVYCQLETYEGWRREARPREPMRAGTTVGDYLFVHGGFIQTSCLLVPRSLAALVPFDEELRAHQDIQFVLGLEAAGATFAYVDQPLVRYSTAPDEARISSSRSPERSEAFLERHGHLLGPRARLGFEARLLALRWARSGRRAKGVSTLVRAARAGVMSPRDVGWLLPRALVSEGTELMLRRAIAGARRAAGSVGRAGT